MQQKGLTLCLRKLMQKLQSLPSRVVQLRYCQEEARNGKAGSKHSHCYCQLQSPSLGLAPALPQPGEGGCRWNVQQRKDWQQKSQLQETSYLPHIGIQCSQNRQMSALLKMFFAKGCLAYLCEG